MVSDYNDSNCNDRSSSSGGSGSGSGSSSSGGINVSEPLLSKSIIYPYKCN